MNALPPTLPAEVPDAAALRAAADRIAPLVHRTPVLTSAGIDALAGAEVFFKCENFQKVGAFKMRGAANAALSLSVAERARGLATHSSGNHAQAVARAAQALGVPAYIVMPETAPRVKVAAVRGYEADITFCPPTLAAREKHLAAVVARTGAAFVHPYDDYRVVAGQGTAALELFEDTSDLDTLLVPVGGGGLLAGTLLAAHYFSPTTRVVAGEPAGADDAYRSWQTGRRVPSVAPQTIADGLLTSLGERNFLIIKQLVDQVVVTSEEEIIAAMRLIWERMKIIVEPSCAVPLAVLLQRKDRYAGQKVGIILTGGNVDLNQLPF